MFGEILNIWKYIRNLLRKPLVSTLCKFIMYPLLMQIIFTVLMITYKIAYGTEQKTLDLTWDFNEKTIYWPGVQKFNFSKTIATSKSGYWYASNEFESAEHGGTHLDAPYHFNREGWKVSDIPIVRLLVNAIVVDFSSEVETAGPDYIVDTKVLENKLKGFEPIPNNTVLLIKYGWSKYWSDEKQYMRQDDKEVHHFPGLDNSSATFIARDGRFVGVGIDTSSLDAGISTEFEAHRIILARNMYILENTKMTENFPDKLFTLIVAPMKLADGSGAPVRIFAIIT